jgi:short-subunit dehydrogenase
VEIAGARILIVGATGGFGSALARAFSAAGADLVVASRNATSLAAIAAEVGAIAVPTDLTEDGAPEALVMAASTVLGGLEAVVCAIGVVAFGPAVDVDDDTIERLFRVNTLAPMRLSRAALGALSRGGLIVNVSAIVATMPTAGMAAYSASKAALSAFDAAIAREGRRVGIRVLDLRPPHMETGLSQRPIAGEAPTLGPGKDPDAMARRVVEAIAQERDEVGWDDE